VDALISTTGRGKDTGIHGVVPCGFRRYACLMFVGTPRGAAHQARANRRCWRIPSKGQGRAFRPPRRRAYRSELQRQQSATGSDRTQQ